MRHADILDRLAGLGGDKWQVHFRARDLAAAGRDIIALTIGEPDQPTPPDLVDHAIAALRAGRTGYSSGAGDAGLRAALATRYSAQAGRVITPDQVLCLPGTQSALFAVMMGLTDAGDEVLVGDPMYATYEAVIRASGARPVPVPLRATRGFRLCPDDLAVRITPASRVILLNTPHNPTGAVLSAQDLAGIGALARAHDLWIVCDEVYAEIVFDGADFASALAQADLADRVIVVSSISKSHAAPGFRSGWAIGPADWAARQVALCEAMLFGNQPFIADMTAIAVAQPSAVAVEMSARFAHRADMLARRIEAATALRVHRPEAGMFALIDVCATGQDGQAFAMGLLEQAGVAVMPGAAFGTSLHDWVRVALTVSDADIDRACDRIIAHVATLPRRAAS